MNQSMLTIVHRFLNNANDTPQSIYFRLISLVIGTVAKLFQYTQVASISFYIRVYTRPGYIINQFHDIILPSGGNILAVSVDNKIENFSIMY